MTETGKNYDFMVDKACDKSCSARLDKKFMIYLNWNLVCVRWQLYQPHNLSFIRDLVCIYTSFNFYATHQNDGPTIPSKQVSTTL